MRHEPTCPRCAAPVRAPGLWSSSWTCEVHGAVLPFHPLGAPTPELAEHVVEQSKVPVWIPWPLPVGWVVTGYAYAGDERSGARATAVALSGPGLLGGPSDMLLIAEEPGIGLAAHYAGLPSTDPGEGFDLTAPHAKCEAAGHPTAMWCLDTGQEPVTFVGEAKGLWLWALVWPESAGVLMYDDLKLCDLREMPDLDIPYGALSPKLNGSPQI